MRTVLVLGATGFVGRRLVAELLQAGHRVRCLVRDPQRAGGLADDRDVEVVRGDMLDADAVDRAAESVHAVYVVVHTLSKQPHAQPGSDFMDVEQTGLRTVIDAATRHGVRRLLYVTSIGISPEVRSSWGRGRARTEQMLFASGLDVTVLRPGMIVGPGGDGFGMVARGARSRVAVLLASRTQRFRTVAVDDLASALVQLLDDSRSYGRHYDVGSDDILTIDQMIDRAAAHLGRRPPLKLHLPRRAIAALAPLLERVTGMPKGAVAGFVGPGADADLVGDATPIRPLLSHHPLTYDQAMATALATARR